MEASQVRSACAARPYQNQSDVMILSEESSLRVEDTRDEGRER